MNTDLHVAPFVAPPSASAPRDVAQAILTIKELLDIFQRRHVNGMQSPRSLLCRLKNHFPPLHHRTLQDLTVLDIMEWRDNIIARSPVKIINGRPVHSTVQASACISDLRNLYNRAIEWNVYHGSNTASRVKKTRSPMRTTYIREHQMPAVLEAIDAQPLMERIHFRALLEVFCRPMELQHQRVEDVQIWKQPLKEGGFIWRGLWIKPAATTKKKREQVTHLAPKLAEMYAQYIPTLAKGSIWMFPGRGGARPRSKECWFMRWDEVRQQAGIPEIWLYDLRRTGSTWAYDTSKDLASISKGGLGHTSLKSTDHYLQVMDGAVAAMLDKHEERLLACAGE